MGFIKVWLQVDSLAVLGALTNSLVEDEQHSNSILQIRDLMNRNWEVKISRIYREGNRVAHLLAHHVHGLDLGTHLNLSLPKILRWLFSVIVSGLASRVYYRLIKGV
ncbi:hypothetical protein LINPERPRIM_LOCUS12262 [Linum perenne]